MDHPALATWAEALGRALGGAGTAGAGSMLFREAREDLSAELILESGRPRSTHTRISGLSARGPLHGGRLVYLAEAAPEDAGRLMRLALDASSQLPIPGERRESGDLPGPTICPADVSRQLESLVHRASTLAQQARVRATWVGFEQTIQVAAPGRPVVADHRRGRRVRLELSTAIGEDGAQAVVEQTLRPGEEADVERLCAEATVRLDRRRRARPAVPGERRVVFASGVGGILVHELVGHALEADATGGSWLARSTERIAPDSLLVLDDPRRARAAWHVDDEGEPARPIPLIRLGRVAGRLHDQRTAALSGERPTGHGRRASFRDPVRPRMGCTFVAAGGIDAGEVIAKVDEGLLIRRMEVARTDPRTGESLFRVTEADRIRRGRIDAPLRPLLMRVDARTALAAIDQVANDLAFDTCIGSCLRDGQPLAISVGAPTFCAGLVSVVS